ncbi:MAG: GIY-YIG nuclease family protein [Candidatus Omnitrophica bacterium]|nr:GIY-YIG nuclease family protein [Candidatus Omnitrophota bacterium]
MSDNIYSKPWFVYIAECKDGTFYAGIAKDVDKRINVHNRTNKCRYTRFRKPLELKYKQMCSNYNTARKREREIKKFSREKKFALINS